MISSCPLPHPGPESAHNPAPGSGSAPVPNPRLSPKLSSSPNLDQTYSQITLPAAIERGGRERRGGGGGGASPCTPPLIPPEPEYSLPFDTIATNVMANILSAHQDMGDKSAADPLYDSIDEMKIRNVFPSSGDAVGSTYGKVDHIYDEPEGCATAAAKATATKIPATSVYDDPEEMRGDAWRVMGTAADPKGHQYPYNPRVDDYAVPKRAQRALPVTQSTDKEEDSEEESRENEEEKGEEQHDSPYNNVMVKMM